MTETGVIYSTMKKYETRITKLDTCFNNHG